MSSHNAIPELDVKGLRDFGVMTGAVSAILFGLFFPWLLDAAYPLWPWFIAGILVLWAFTAPASLRPLYRVWMRVGLAIGWVMTRVVLSIVFFLMITPFGLIMRLSNDPMRRTLDKNADTYRIISKKRDIKHMERPF